MATKVWKTGDVITSTELNRIEETLSNISNQEVDLSNYYTKEQVYNKTEVDNKISEIQLESGSFISDWGTVSIQQGGTGTGTTPSQGNIPDGYGKNYIYYDTNRWIAFNNSTDMNTVKVSLQNGTKFTSDINVDYQYSSSNGQSWTKYIDKILLNTTGINSITECTIDLYGNDYSTVIREKDSFGSEELVDNTIKVQMARGNTEALNQYVELEGQLVVDIETKQLRIMDGITEGGTIIQGNITGGDGENSGDIESANIFPTIAIMKQANLPSGSYAITLGYYEEGDGGGATYQILSSSAFTTDSNGRKYRKYIKRKELNNPTQIEGTIEGILP